MRGASCGSGNAGSRSRIGLAGRESSATGGGSRRRESPDQSLRRQRDLPWRWHLLHHAASSDFWARVWQNSSRSSTTLRRLQHAADADVFDWLEVEIVEDGADPPIHHGAVV